MRRNRFRIRTRLWLALAAATVSFAFVSSASAQLLPSDGSNPITTPPPAVVVTAPHDEFNWGDALVGAGVALVVAAGSIAVVYVARQHRRTGLAT
jgi:hypothetical protein